MWLHKVAFANLQVGDEVISAKGTVGKIVRLIPKEQAEKQEDNEVAISWDNGNQSCIWHFWCDKIKYLGPKLQIETS